MDLQVIQNRIFEIRGERVMIDRDLAEIYGVETRILNQAVKRNSERFPSDFMFQLTDIEFQHWKSQIVISNAVNMGLRKKPFVFTELGVAMLSSVLNSKTAIQINMNIMRAFVAVRNMLSTSPEDRVSELYAELKTLKDYIDEVFSDYNDINEDTRLQIELINQSLAELHIDKKHNSKPKNKIGYLVNNNDDDE
jgi:hypothetical protein